MRPDAATRDCRRWNHEMKMRRAILFGMPASLYALCLAFMAICIIDIKAHTEFTDHALALLAPCLFLAYPLAIVIMWWAGRKGDFRHYDKLIAWLSMVPVLIPWGFVCMGFLAMLSFCGSR